MFNRLTFLPLLAPILVSGVFLKHGCSPGGAGAGDCTPGVVAAKLLPICFLKTHKTGSSTMTNILHRLTEHRHLRLIFPNDDKMVNWQILLRTEPPVHQYDMVLNHNIFNETTARDYLKPSPFFFSILRDPVTATDSLFRYLPYNVETWPLRLAHMRQHCPYFCNSFARDLGWYGTDTRRLPDDAPLREANASAVAAFLEYMDRTLHLVLLTEYFDEGLVLLRRKLGLSLEEVAYVRMKEAVGGPAVLPPPTPEERKVLLDELLPVDASLYEHFQRRFWRQWEAAGGEAALGRELAALKERNAQLKRACAGGPSEGCPREVLADNVPYTIHLRHKAGGALPPA